MPRAVFLLDCFKISSFQQSNKRFYPIYIIPPLTARVKDVDEKLSWLQISQHQFQENVTHGLTLVLIGGRNNECDFSDLICKKIAQHLIFKCRICKRFSAIPASKKKKLRGEICYK